MKNKSPYDADIDLNDHWRPQFSWSFFKPKYWGVWITVGFMWLLSLLPYALLKGIANILGKIFATSNLKVIRNRRALARINIDHALANLPQERRDRIYKNFCRNMGHGVIDVIIAWFWSQERFKAIIKLPENNFDAYIDKKHFLFLCPHFLTLESTARAIGLVYPSYGVYLPSNNPLWDYLQYNFRIRFNKGLVSSLNLKEILKTLSYKRGLYYAPDQDLGNKKSAINVPFFDVEEVATTKGTYMLYRKYRDLTLVPCILLESKDPNYIYEFKILEPLTFAEDATERDVVSQTNKKIEEMVKMDIDNYLWLHRRFKNSPGCEHLYDSIKIEHSYEKKIRKERERYQRHQEQQAQQAQQSQQTKDTEQVEPNKNPDHSGKN